MDPATEQGSSPEWGQDASNGARFLTVLVDQIIVRVITVAGIAVPILIFGLKDELVAGLMGFALGPIYYVVLESTTGRTVGKLLVGTKVVTIQYGVPTLGQIIGRTLIRYVPFEPLSFLFGKAGWHDSWSATRVIRMKKEIAFR